MIVGYSAGGGPDWAARILGQQLTQLLGQPVVVDNRAGANGVIAAELAARAPADGYTLMMLAIAVTSLKRSAAATDIPTVAETLPGFEAIGWYGVVAPRGTSPGTVDRLQRAIEKSVQSPEVKTRLAVEGSEGVGSTPQQFGGFLRGEMARFAKVIKEAGIGRE